MQNENQIDRDALRAELVAKYRRRMRKREGRPEPEQITCSMCGEGPLQRKTLVTVGDQKRCLDHANENLS